jgi:DNA-binding transcriptional ArsR family regulator
MNHRALKDHQYEQVARIGKALASPKRLELLDLLAQGEKAVEVLAAQASIDVKLASAHLKALKDARLVQVRRDGRYMVYRLSGPDVDALGVALREVAQAHLAELQQALQQKMPAAPQGLAPIDRHAEA